MFDLSLDLIEMIEFEKNKINFELNLNELKACKKC
jgi:hypothetical protein